MEEAKNDKLDGTPWLLKYRETNLSKIRSHDTIVKTLQSFIQNKNLPHLLFTGPPGTGKTSTALAIAAQLYGPRYNSMILELNASSERGIETIREKVKIFATSQHLYGDGDKDKIKLIILDEADSLIEIAQAALRTILEKNVYNCRFILICNETRPIISALQSRCTQFFFKPLEDTEIIKRLKEIALSEGFVIEDSAFPVILGLAQGDMRQAIVLLQSTFKTHHKVNAVNVSISSGKPLPTDIQKIFQSLWTDPVHQSFQIIHNLLQQNGYHLRDIISGLYPLIVDVKQEQKYGYFLSPILEELSDIEYRLSQGCTDYIQLSAFVAICRKHRKKQKK